jgi:Cu/Ag efflux protein CusF
MVRGLSAAASAMLAFNLSPARAADLFPDRGLATSPAPRLWFAQAATPAAGVFHGFGVVMAIDAASRALTLDHEEIKGLMPAMEMMYRVQSPDLSRGLGVGDRIAVDLDAASYTIVAVERLTRGDAKSK